jgi:hypothetical protein
LITSGAIGTALLLSVGSSSFASTQSGLTAQASAIASTIASEDQSMTSLGEQYLAEQSAAASSRAKAKQTSHTIAAIDRNIATARVAAEKAAIDAYIYAGSDNNFALIIGNSPDNISTGQEYLGVAQRELATTIATLLDDEHSLLGAEKVESSEEAAEQNALEKTASDRATVIASMNAERNLLSSVNGQLAQLIAEQQAARALAAQEAAAKLPASQGTNASPQAGPPTPTAVTTLASAPTPPSSIEAAFAEIRNCESHDNYSDDTGNGYYGAYQFSLPTWLGVGGSGLPSAAAPAIQDALAYKLYQRDGFSPWPACAAFLGLL